MKIESEKNERGLLVIVTHTTVHILAPDFLLFTHICNHNFHDNDDDC